MTALAPLASILEAFSAALLEAAAGGQPGGQAQTQGSSEGAPFTSLLEDLIEEKQPGAQAILQAGPSAEKPDSSAAKTRPDEKAPSSPDQAALAMWLGQAPMPLGAPPTPDSEPTQSDAAAEGPPAAEPEQADDAAKSGAVEVARSSSPPEGGMSPAPVEKPVVPAGSAGIAERAWTASQKSGSGKEAAPAVAANDFTAEAAGLPAAPPDEVVVAAQAPAVETRKGDAPAPADGERKTDKTRGKPADGTRPTSSLPPLPVAPSLVEAPADRHREQQPVLEGPPAASRQDLENPIAAPDGRTVAQSAPASELAFRARLVPVTPAGRQPGQVQPPPAPTDPSAGREPAPAVRRPEAPDAADDQRQPAAPPQPKAEPRAEVRAQPEGDALLQSIPPATVRAASPAAAPERSPRATGTEPAQPAEPPQPSNPPELKQTALRDIRFELNGPDRRVEVRLTERAGEIEVSVRTPDSRLAADLRENLPALSSRLEQTGFRPEGLAHDGGLTADAHRHDVRQTSESGSGDSGQGSREPGERQREGQHQQRSRTPEELRDSKSKGKDFSWFLSTQA